MKQNEKIEYAIEEIKKILLDINSLVDLIIVEGTRDVEALRDLGYSGKIEVCYHTGMNEIDFVSRLNISSSRILLLTDFDDKGKLLNKRLSTLLESYGARLERELRRSIGKLMKMAGISTVESLDNIDRPFLKNTPDYNSNSVI